MTFKVTFSYDVEVEAETKEEAATKAYDDFSEGLSYYDIRPEEFTASTPEEA